MINLTGQRGVPVITVDSEVIIGFNRPRLDQLLSKDRQERPISLGISIADADRIIQKLPSKPRSGAYIGAVKPMSFGEKAGLKTGDIITEINSQEIRTANDLEKVLSSAAGINKLSITFLRDRDVRNTEILL